MHKATEKREALRRGGASLFRIWDYIRFSISIIGPS